MNTTLSARFIRQSVASLVDAELLFGRVNADADGIWMFLTYKVISNGGPAAALQTLADETIDPLFAATNLTRQITVATERSVTLDDGSTNAPTRTPEFANLLNSYVVRPPWKVAGVDYYVGVPSGTILKSPSTISMAGVSIDSANHIVYVNGQNVTLTGYDFSLNGGWQVYLSTTSAANITIENCNFKVGSNNLIPIAATYGGSLTVLHCTFDLGGSSGATDAYAIQVGSGALIEYNRFTDMPQDGIGISPGSPAGNYTIKFNLFDSLGWNSESHNQNILVFGSSPTSLAVVFNTWYQPTAHGLAPTNSFIRIGDEGAGNTVHNPTIAYNTIVLPGSGQTANVFDLSASSGACVNPTVYDNYIDPTGAVYGILSPYQNQLANLTTYNNVNLGNGATILFTATNSQSGAPSSSPAAPTITGDRVSSDQVTLIGTAPANTTIDILDPTNTNPWPAALYGTATANSSGAWSFTTGALASGSHAFTATATDLAGNTSAASQVFNISVGRIPHSQPITIPATPPR